MDHLLNRLPKWAQLLIEEKDREIEALEKQNDTLKRTHAILADEDRNWFTLPGPNFRDEERYRYLWLLDRDDPMRICSLGPGDVLFVGRAKKE